MDNNIVRMLTTVHPWNKVTHSLWGKPQKTSTNAALGRKAFGNRNRAAFFISTAIDDYNHYMGGVDIADQRRAGTTPTIESMTGQCHRQDNVASLEKLNLFLKVIN